MRKCLYLKSLRLNASLLNRLAGIQLVLMVIIKSDTCPSANTTERCGSLSFLSRKWMMLRFRLIALSILSKGYKLQSVVTCKVRLKSELQVSTWRTTPKNVARKLRLLGMYVLWSNTRSKLASLLTCKFPIWVSEILSATNSKKTSKLWTILLCREAHLLQMDNKKCLKILQ